MAKHIFVTGGVVSSLGKGITAASLGTLLKARGLKVVMQKMDPYLNVDPGTMNPYQHGEVFVTDDGAETDLDLGHYERFIDQPLSKASSVSSGQIYQRVIRKERRGDYNGNTVQVIPHITNEIKSCVMQAAENVDVVITEVGGTVGDIEGQPFLEAFRQLRFELGPENCVYVHVTLLPYLSSSNELKTKPTQHSVKVLQEMGIQPNYIICRTDFPLPDTHRKKIALFCNVKEDHVIENLNCESLYAVPLMLQKFNFDTLICQDLQLEPKEADMTVWEELVKRHVEPKNTVNIALVGKYVQLHDAFLSVVESLVHAGIHNDARVNIRWVSSDNLTADNVAEHLEGVDAILVPGGFGNRGLEGKILACNYAIDNKIPYLGICLGMQIAMITLARRLAGLEGANTTEADVETAYPVIDRMKDQVSVILGGTMRLGAYKCELKEGTLIHKAYGTTEISERHRHRYEVNSDYVPQLEEAGVCFTGRNPISGLVETFELPTEMNPWFVAVQYHPEFKSRPNRPHPLFRDFVEAALKIASEKPMELREKLAKSVALESEHPCER